MLLPCEGLAVETFATLCGVRLYRPLCRALADADDNRWLNRGAPRVSALWFGPAPAPIPVTALAAPDDRGLVPVVVAAGHAPVRKGQRYLVARDMLRPMGRPARACDLQVALAILGRLKPAKPAKPARAAKPARPPRVRKRKPRRIIPRKIARKPERKAMVVAKGCLMVVRTASGWQPIAAPAGRPKPAIDPDRAADIQRRKAARRDSLGCPALDAWLAQVLSRGRLRP